MTACLLAVCDQRSGKHNRVQTETRKHQKKKTSTTGWSRRVASQKRHAAGLTADQPYLASMTTALYWQPWEREVWMLPCVWKASQEVGPWLSSCQPLGLLRTKCFLPQVVKISKEENPLWPVRKCSKVTFFVLYCGLLRWGLFYLNFLDLG